jgi:glutaminase
MNPVTREQVIAPDLCWPVLAVMATAGMYEHSGEWLYDVGLPGKSGIGGGVLTVSPGKAGLGSFSPRLDAAGNSVRGVLASTRLVAELGLGLFSSRPA